jgi:hypothetical protein
VATLARKAELSIFLCAQASAVSLSLVGEWVDQDSQECGPAQESQLPAGHARIESPSKPLRPRIRRVPRPFPRRGGRHEAFAYGGGDGMAGLRMPESSWEARRVAVNWKRGVDSGGLATAADALVAPPHMSVSLERRAACRQPRRAASRDGRIAGVRHDLAARARRPQGAGRARTR